MRQTLDSHVRQRGVPVPVTLYRIVRASGGGRRGGARALTPLVGREDELALLRRRWSRALEGEGQFVQIVGEPGIGKSRLVEEFRAKLADTPHTWVEWAASQLLQNTPLHPLAEWGRLRYGGADASDGQKLADLENTLPLIGLDAAEYAPLLAPLFDVPLPEDRAAKFAPEELRCRQLAAMTALFTFMRRSLAIRLKTRRRFSPIWLLNFPQRIIAVSTNIHPAFADWRATFDEDMAEVSPHPFAVVCRVNKMVHTRMVSPRPKSYNPQWRAQSVKIRSSDCVGLTAADFGLNGSTWPAM